MLMAISLLLVVFSSIGIDKTYHPIAEQTAEREQIAAEKDTEKEDSNESLDMSKPDSVSDETANTSFAFAESTVSEKDKRDSEISETTKPGFVPDETTDIFSVAAESTISEKDKNTTLEKEMLESDKLEVSFDVSVDENGGKPIFTINTNLPDETSLMLTLNGNNYTAQAQVTVKDGVTSSNAFSSNGNSLAEGEYVLTVSMSIPKLQPDNVRAIIGESGENMTGEYVEASGIGDSMCLSGDFQFSFLDFGYGEDESNSGNEDFIETYKTEIVVSSKMILDNFINNYKIPLAPQLWTIAKFDDEGAVIAIADITEKSTKVSETAIVVLTPIMEGNNMTGSTPHYVSVGNVIYGNDGYCDEVFSYIEEIFNSQ